MFTWKILEIFASGHRCFSNDEWHEIEALEDETVFVNVFAEGKY